MNAPPDPNTAEAMKALVRQYEGGKVIYRARRGDAWQCKFSHLGLVTSALEADLVP
jgi:hypothetical protein